MATLMHYIETGDKRGAKRKLETIRRNTYAKGFMDGLIQFIKPNDICIDCGANVGIFTTQFAKKGAHVTAFEPDPIAFAELTKNTSEFGNVELINAAVGMQDGASALYRDERFNNNPIEMTVASTLVPGMYKRSTQHAETVRVVAFLDVLKSMIEKHGSIRLLKIDIEGAEVEILEAMIAQDLFKNIDITLVETHETQRFDKAGAYAALRKSAQENPDWGLFLDLV